jgi:hypothetical protein
LDEKIVEAIPPTASVKSAVQNGPTTDGRFPSQDSAIQTAHAPPNNTSNFGVTSDAASEGTSASGTASSVPANSPIEMVPFFTFVAIVPWWGIIPAVGQVKLVVKEK